MHKGGVLINRSTLLGVTVAFDRCQRSNLGAAEWFDIIWATCFLVQLWRGHRGRWTVRITPNCRLSTVGGIRRAHIPWVFEQTYSTTVKVGTSKTSTYFPPGVIIITGIRHFLFCSMSSAILGYFLFVIKIIGH